VVNVEAGRQRLPLHTLYALCNELGIEPTEVLPSMAEVSVSADGNDREVVVEGRVRRIPPKTAGLVLAVLDEFGDTDKGAA
jgi:hypothetical protein